MKTRRSIARGTLAVLLVAIAISTAAAVYTFPTSTAAHSPDAVSHSAQTVRIPFNYAGMEDLGENLGVDCIGNGASCEGRLDGSEGEVRVTNNTNPPYYWRFKLTCEFGGDKYSGDNAPSAGTVISKLRCNFDAPAQYWNVLVVHKP